MSLRAQPAVPQGSPLPRILPVPAPAVGPGAPPPERTGAADLPNGAAPVSRIVFVGATAYSTPQLSAMADGLTGPNTKLAAIEVARRAMVDRYRDDGYLLTTVFADLDGSGVLTFTVTEGRIASVKLDGDIGPAGTLVLRLLNHLTEKRPIDTATLERWLLLAQDIPGVTLRAILRPSTEDPGALTLVAEVSRASFNGLLTTDNSGYSLSGPAQGLLAIDANSFTEYGEKTSVSVYHTSGDTANFGQVASQFFLGDTGLRLQLYGGYGPTNPSSPLRDIGYLATTAVAGASASYPVIRARSQTLDVTAALEVIESQISVTAGDGRETISRDRLRIMRVGSTYAVHDSLLGDDMGAINAIKLRLSRGLPWFGAATQLGAGAASGKQLGFGKMNLEFSRTQSLFEPWAGANVSAVGLVTLQLSRDRVPAAEQFQLGGLQLNPGYYSGQVTGDSGAGLYGELQLNDRISVNFGRQLDANMQLFAFGAGGKTWSNNPPTPSRTIGSAGGGLRVFTDGGLEFHLMGVTRFARNPSGAGVAPLPATAIYWRTLFRF